MSVFAKLLEPINGILNELEEGRHKHHNEKLSWMDFIKVLIYHFTIRSDSRNTLAVKLANAEPTLGLPVLAVATISDAFRRFDNKLAHEALKRLLHEIDLPEIPELRLFGSIYLVDGSYFRLPHFTLWRNKWTQGVKLHLQFTLNQMLPTHFVLDEYHSSERKQFTQFLEPSSIFVLDRGYMSYKLLRTAIEQKAYVVLRATSQIVTNTVEELPVELPAAFTGIWQDVRDSWVTSNHEDAIGLQFRLIEFKVGETSYKLICNHPHLTTFEIILLYAYRWQIEIVFRFLKRTMQSLHIITESERGMQTYFATLFITAILHMRLNFDNLQAEGLLPVSSNEAQEEVVDVELVATTKDATVPYPSSAPAKKKSLFWPLLTVSSAHGVFPNTG